MKCKGEISGSCHSTYPLCCGIQAPAGCGMKGCVAHTNTCTQPGQGQPPYSPAGRGIHIIHSSASEGWQIQRSPERGKGTRRVFLRRVVEMHFPFSWASELLEGWELETSRQARRRRRPGKVTKSFPGLLWAGCEEVMTAQHEGRATSPPSKHCQGHGRHYYS